MALIHRSLFNPYTRIWEMDFELSCESGSNALLLFQKYRVKLSDSPLSPFLKCFKFIPSFGIKFIPIRANILTITVLKINIPAFLDVDLIVFKKNKQNNTPFFILFFTQYSPRETDCQLLFIILSVSYGIVRLCNIIILNNIVILYGILNQTH